MLKFDKKILTVNEEGFLVNNCSYADLQDNWKELLEDFTLRAVDQEPNIHSIYVRGSVAGGYAINGISDLDIILVIDIEKNNPASSDALLSCDWKDKISKSLLDKYSFCDDIDVYLLSKERVL